MNKEEDEEMWTEDVDGFAATGEFSLQAIAKNFSKLEKVKKNDIPGRQIRFLA